jgi:hypothetical protein
MQKPQVEQPQQPKQEVNPLEQALTQYSTSETPQANLQGAIGNEQQLARAYNLDQPMGVEEREYFKRQDELQKRREAQAKELAYSAYVQGTVGTPGSGALAYNKTLANALADEDTYSQQRYKDLASLNTAQRTAQEKRSGIAGADFAAQQKAAADAGKDKAMVGANVYGTQQQAKSSAYSANKHAESSMAIAKLQERMASARQGSAEAKQAASELRDRERAIEADIKSLTSRANKLTGSFAPEDRKELAGITEDLKNARAQYYMVRGGTGAAPAPTGTMTPPPPGAVRLKPKG